tara:strand:- start:1246 stop:1746 length:501 start_codon:yes stop_codon:yes gene_type:complete
LNSLRTAVRLSTECHRTVVDHAERSFPQECCGLLIGEEANGLVQVAEIHESENLANDPGRRFEVDPALRLKLQRSLRGSGHRIIGIYHSHPDGPAHPSPRDLEAAWEPELVWLIMSVRSEGVIESTVHVLTGDEDSLQFSEVPLQIQEMGCSPGNHALPASDLGSG